MNILLKEAAPDILTEFNKELDAIILGYPTWSMNFKEGYKSAIRDFKLILKQEYGIDLDEVVAPPPPAEPSDHMVKARRVCWKCSFGGKIKIARRIRAKYPEYFSELFKPNN